MPIFKVSERDVVSSRRSECWIVWGLLLFDLSASTHGICGKESIASSIGREQPQIAVGIDTCYPWCKVTDVAWGPNVATIGSNQSKFFHPSVGVDSSVASQQDDGCQTCWE